MLKFVITQMVHFYSQPRDKSNTFIIITMKNIIWGRSNKFQDTIFESNDCRRKDRIFEEFV